MSDLQVRGPLYGGSGTPSPFTADYSGAQRTADAHGRYMDAVLRGNVFSASVGGAGQTLVAVNLFSTAIGTFQPIICLYNPLTSGKALAILQAWVGLSAAPLATESQTGGFFWVGNSGQSITNAVSTNLPVNNYTLKQQGSAAVVVLNAVLAGASGNPILVRPVSAALAAVTATANATVQTSQIAMEEVAGSLIIPPGGYLAIANGISNTVDSAIAGITWEEIVLLP